MLEKVCILLSTYNGEKYLSELLNSLLTQTYRNFEIRIRDDGSTDKTRQILNEYAAKHSNVLVTFGDNIGVAWSFFELLETAGDDCEYFAFCDQDDVWLDVKLERAINVLKSIPKSTYSMYCSNYALVDEDKKILKIAALPDHINPSFPNALLENIAAGCTTVLNKQARSLFLYQRPSPVFAHDWWFYLVVSAFGQVIYDPTTTLYYRQHASNVVGTKASLFEKWKRRAMRYLFEREPSRVLAQVLEFVKIYGAMLTSKEMNIAFDFANNQKSLIKRCKYALCGPAYRQSPIDNLIFKIFYILKKV